MLEISQEKFNGPLGLLLQLIEKEELDITEISLAKIADQYIEYIKGMKDINPDEMADFLVVAAKLLLAKSKALLPYLYPEEEEEIDDLECQLKIYKEFLEASKKIEELIGEKKFMFVREWNRQSVLKNMNLFSPPKNLMAENMLMVFKDLLVRLRPAEKLAKDRIEQVLNIEDKIMNIQKMLVDRIKFGFKSVLGNAKNKTEIIVSFLAMLELVKQREIFVIQNELFEEMEINKLNT